ncbi:MAG: DegV family EDD domain-containing protein, partial [Lachnospiraceae bacterium]|nr:DegV family EDD domain-containing protein [Lachnospiraceae bacterium]
LINDILDFSKIEAGSMDIVPVDYKVGDMMSEIVNMIWLRTNEKGLSFDVDIDPHVPSVLFGDEVRIKQIIINLLNNAVKYTKKGSVGLHIEAEDADEGKVRLLISVSDTGIGIKQEMLPDLFNVFKRVDQEINRNIEGTGLGLSIVKQLVDLMGGDISVNSAYGQGSTFTVSLVQEISDSRMLGNINISSQGETHHRYEHMFTASDARILIVDDNEMNLEVERKLLTDTRLTVDTAKSGTEALVHTLEKHYDVILMDHLMPGMDGIECLKNIRSQTGGLNVDVPAVVLTANAGSQNRELYNASGFDGYLVKPVSGSELEEMLIKFIPQDKLILNKSIQMNSEEVSTARGYSRKQPVVFTSSSLCDIPETLRKRMGIDILYHTIVTDEGMFRDNVEMSADETVRYMDSGRDAKGVAPEVAAYEEFFGRLLRKAHHVIYIALTTSMSEDYERAMMAARSFGNVTVINSECMSSSLALLLLVGYKLAQQNVPVEKIVAELESVKKRMHSGFIMGTTEYMARKGLVGQRIHRIASSMEVRPALRYKNDKYSIGGLWMGSIRHCYEGYIKKSLPLSANPDPDILFVTYVAIPEEELIWIEKQIRKRCDFEHIIFQQASSVITTNSGPGTFGLLYMQKGQRSYNLGSLLPNDVHYDDGDAQEDHISDEEVIKTKPTIREWYDELEGIDGSVAIENSGSEEAFRTVLKMFYDAIPEKADEIDTYFKNGDWNDYTIKVHALKSSAKLIGALGLSEEAAKLEDAGKSQDTGYINENHEAMMERYREYRIKLANLFAEPPDTDIPAKPAGKPEADEELILMAIDELNDAAGEKDSERIKNVLAELDDYSIPDKYGKMWDEIINAADGNGFETIIGLLKEHKA